MVAAGARSIDVKVFVEVVELTEFAVCLPIGREIFQVFINLCVTISGDVTLQPAHCLGYIADPSTETPLRECALAIPIQRQASASARPVRPCPAK